VTPLAGAPDRRQAAAAAYGPPPLAVVHDDDHPADGLHGRRQAALAAAASYLGRSEDALGVSARAIAGQEPGSRPARLARADQGPDVVHVLTPQGFAPAARQPGVAAVHHVLTPQGLAPTANAPAMLFVPAKPLAGPLGADSSRAMAILAEITGYLTLQGGARWMQLMRLLNDAARSWQEVRDWECGVDRYGYYAAQKAGGCPGDQASADDAERRYTQVLQVRDYLAEVYRRYDDFGLEGLAPEARGNGQLAGSPGALGEPTTLLTIAAIAGAIGVIVAGAGVFAWALGTRRDAQTRAEAMDLAKKLCAQDPNSQACLDAIGASRKPPEPESGVPWGLLAVAGVAAVGLATWLKR